MMTSSNGNIFRVTGPLCGEFTGPGDFPVQRPVTRSFDVFFDLCLNNGWVNNREAGAHYDVIVMDTVNQKQTRTKQMIAICFNHVPHSYMTDRGAVITSIQP